MSRMEFGAAVAGMIVVLAAPAVSAFAQTQTFSIPAQPLDDALTRFGASTGFQLLYDASLALGRRSTAVEGVMEPRQALMRLLDGTGLSARFTSRGAVVIYATSASTAVALKPITAVAAPLVGRRDDGAMRAYADRARLHVAEAVRRDPELTRSDAVVRLRLRVDAEGRVSDVALQEGAGDAAWDARFLALVSGLRFEVPPPELTQSLRMEFRVSRGR
ncbi:MULTISPECIES: TonB family protein [unclassified Brevundimonas]|nr:MULTISPECIES: TonB family protein [unclassified Brevundimonas]